jgi:hypothetical protein
MALKDIAYLLVPPIRRLHENRNRLAFELAAHQPIQTLLLLARRCGVDLALDVGAAQGQFARQLRNVGFRGKIISFEPLSTTFSVLKPNAAKTSTGPVVTWRLATRTEK